MMIRSGDCQLLARATANTVAHAALRKSRTLERSNGKHRFPDYGFPDVRRQSAAAPAGSPRARHVCR